MRCWQTRQTICVLRRTVCLSGAPVGHGVACSTNQPTPLVVQVNKRVATEELTDLSGDRLFPKVQWPGPELCPRCRQPSTATAAASESTALEPEWDEDEVFAFLQRFYGDDARRESAAQEFGGGRCGVSLLVTPLIR